MSFVTAKAKNIYKAPKKGAQQKTVVDREGNARKINKVNKQKPARAELLKSYIYNDLSEHLSDAVKSDINSDEPIRVVNFDYGDRGERNSQWVQYMKPEIISKALIAKDSRGPFCSRVFAAVFVSFLITGSVAFATWFVPDLAVILKGVIGLSLLMGSIFLFLLTFSIMLSPCSIGCPCNLLCYIFLFASSSITSGVMVAHSGGAEVVLAVSVLGGIIFLFFIMSLFSVDFTGPYFYVMGVVMVLSFFSIGVFILCATLKVKVTLLHMFVALTYSIIYIICVILQVQMILGAKGIELTKGDWLFGAATVFMSIVFVFKNILQMIHQYNLI